MTLLRAGALITAYEIREDFAQHAIKNVRDMLGEHVEYDVKIRDVTEGIDEVDLDRVILDMPEPWDVVKHAERAVATRRHFLDLSADHYAGSISARGAEPTLIWLRGVRGDSPANLARRRALRATGSPNGGAHWILDFGSASGGATGKGLVALHEDAFAGHSSAASRTASSNSGGTMATPSVPRIALHVVALFT